MLLQILVIVKVFVEPYRKILLNFNKIFTSVQNYSVFRKKNTVLHHMQHGNRLLLIILRLRL